MGDVYIFLCIIFQHYHPGFFMADAMRNPRGFSILSCVLKTKVVELNR